MSDDENFNPEEDETPEDDMGFTEFIREMQSKSTSNPVPEGRIDYSSFREDSQDSWQDVCEGDTLPEKLTDLVRKSILLPRQDFQLPLVVAYLMLPSALCKRLPILFCQGASGSGKSTLGQIACHLHRQQPIGAGSTFASIRNVIATARVWDSQLSVDSPGNERNTCLVWEDIAPNDMLANDGNIFSLLKNGVDRAGTITIAQLGGSNLTFKIFSPKIISSIHPLYSKFEFRELVRRLMIIQHKPKQLWLAEDFTDSTREFDATELVDLGDISFDGIHTEFRHFWEEKSNLDLWAKTSRSLSSIKSHGIKDALWKISKDLLCCGLVCGLWKSKEDAIEHLRRYYIWHSENIESQASATQKALARFIFEKTTQQREVNEKLVGSPMEWMIKPLEVDAKELKTYVEMLASNGELDVTPSIREIGAAMNALGWELKPNNQQKNTWQPISS